MVSKGSLNVNSQKEICTDKIEQNFEEEKIRCKVLELSWNNWNAILSVQVACTFLIQKMFLNTSLFEQCNGRSFTLLSIVKSDNFLKIFE